MNENNFISVSVIIPTHNRPETLITALESLNKQCFKSFEVHVINDGGEDVSEIIAINWNFPINYITYDKPQGAPYARNCGIKAAKGKYISYLDDDDIVLYNHLETLHNFLESTPSFKIAYTDSYRILLEYHKNKYKEISKEIFHSQDFNRDYLLVANYIAILNVMHEKKCLDKIGYFDENLTSHQDLDLWIRLSRHYEFAHIKKVTAQFYERDKGNSITSSNKERRLKTLEHLYEKHAKLASKKIKFLQKRVLVNMYKSYELPIPQHLEQFNTLE